MEDDRHDLLTILRRAESGRLNYVYSRNATHLGHAGYWDLEQVGDQPCEPYVMQGNFLVTSHPVYRSFLTEKGQELLEALEAGVAVA